MKEKLFKTKKELEKEYNLNSKEIRKLEEKIKILESTTTEHKFYVFAKSYAISLPVLMILLVIIGINFPNILSSIIGTDTFNVVRCLFIGPIVPSIISERIISKINDKKLNKFSGTKTEYQKREEILGYELEKQKLNDKNMAIDKAYGFVSDLETKVDVCNLDFGNSNMSKLEQEKNNKKLRENISIKERELEISSTKLFLNENFVMLRTKPGKLGTIGIPFMTGLLSYLFTSAGALIIEPALLMNPMFNTIGLIGGIAGVAVSIVPIYIRNKQNRKIFNKFNNRLGENKLPENTDSYIKEGRTIVTKGNKTIEELVTAHLVYQDGTRELERIQEEAFINKGIECGYKKEEVKEAINIIGSVVENYGINQKEVEGPTLVKRK